MWNQFTHDRQSTHRDERLKSVSVGFSPIFCLIRLCFVTHTLWNGRIVEIRPLILWGLRGGFSDAF